MRTRTSLFYFIILVLFSCNVNKDDKIHHGKIHVDDFQIEFKDCAIDDMGNSYFTGYVLPDYGAEDVAPPQWLKGCDRESMVLFKLDPNGKEISLERFPEVSVGNAILVTENNDVVVVGYYSDINQLTEEGRLIDVTLTRFNVEGKKLWSEVICSGYEVEGLEVVEIENELYVLTKKPNYTENDVEYNAVIVKVSAQGKVISQTKVQHKGDVYPYQMVAKSGKIFLTAHIGGNGVVVQINAETGVINNSFGWDKLLSYPSLSVHPDGIVVLFSGNDYSPIVLFDEELNEIRRDSLKFDVNDGGYLRICSDLKGATYILSANANNKMELIKYNNQLKILWRKEMDDTPSFKIGGITVTKDGNILTSGRVGSEYLNGDGYYSMFTSDGKVY